MKIAILNLYAGGVERGAETFSQALAEKLNTDHKIIWYKGKSKVTPQHQFMGSCFNKLKKRFFLDKANREVLSFTLKILKNLLSQNTDIVIPINGFWQVLLLKIIQPFSGYKILITGHSGPGWDERWNLYLKPNVFIATTLPSFEWSKTVCSWAKIELIPYGVDDRIFKKSKTADIKLPKPIILCPSALVPYKRVDLAIKAVADLSDASLLVLGKGEEETKIAAQGRKLLGNRFMLTSVPYSEMPGYYAAADIITLPSSPQENSPMVFPESLAAGKLVVTTDTLRNRWMLEKAGIYCNSEDLKSYKTALQDGLVLSKMETSDKHINQALKKFLWKKVLKQYFDVLKSLKDSTNDEK